MWCAPATNSDSAQTLFIVIEADSAQPSELWDEFVNILMFWPERPDRRGQARAITIFIEISVQSRFGFHYQLLDLIGLD